MSAIPFLALLLQAASPSPATPVGDTMPSMERAQLDECLALAARDPRAALAKADGWIGNERHNALYCKGVALAGDYQFTEALATLERAAAMATNSKRPGNAAPIEAMAGNVAIALGNADGALAAFDRAAALLSAFPGAMDGKALADMQLDRAVALGSLGRDTDAEAVLAKERSAQAQNADVWLLSATLARRMDRLSDARAHILTAIGLAPQNAAIMLEAGNIAAAAGDLPNARRQWEAAIRADAKSRAADTARLRIKELDAFEAAAPK